MHLDRSCQSISVGNGKRDKLTFRSANGILIETESTEKIFFTEKSNVLLHLDKNSPKPRFFPGINGQCFHVREMIDPKAQLLTIVVLQCDS